MVVPNCSTVSKKGESRCQGRGGQERKMDSRTVGIVGGGQLGRMMAEAALRIGVKIAVLDPLGKESPAGQVCWKNEYLNFPLTNQ